jgi:2-oxoglutarate dehydrogenase E2 component (dihydrolipoamide succinyltransferase)
MPVDLKIPAVGESITEVVIGAWLKSVGDTVQKDEDLVELETDKATFDLPAPAAGVLTQILKRAGDSAAVGDVIGSIGDATGAAPAKPSQTKEHKAPAPRSIDKDQPAAPAKPAAAKPGMAKPETAKTEPAKPEAAKPEAAKPQPAKPDHAKQATASPSDSNQPSQRAPAPAKPPESSAASPARLGDSQPRTASERTSDRAERVVSMSPIRRRIAQRLVEAQANSALVTTFNEIDMSAVMHLRKKYRDAFQEQYGVKLGFMSFFVKAVVAALAEVPQVNAQVRGSDIVYRDYYDIGIAVGSGKGLVVPVLRNAQQLSFAEIERSIADFARRAGENQLKVDELQGGTFTISNGGVYGSLLSTPIVNPPQSGVLGMHAVQERPVVRDGQIVIRSMMYVALTYDHRIIDGREAVTFLNRVREIVEDPTRLLIEV